MFENNRIFYKIKIGDPTALTNWPIIILQLFTKDGHIITTVNCLKPSALKLHFPLETQTHKVYINTTFTHVLHNVSSLETPGWGMYGLFKV